MTAFFWVSFLFVAYTYLGYPLSLALLNKKGLLPARKEEFEPTVSVVMAVANEEKNIVRRLLNLLGQKYRPQQLEIIVVSDGSGDKTVELSRKVGSDRVKIVELQSKGGKAAALNEGVALATGDILLFCDARQTFEEEVVKQLAANFADPNVGCVSGELMLLEDRERGVVKEMGAYWRYEKWIRKMEGATGSVVGATGAIYAIRRKLFRPLPQGTILDDVLTPMNVVTQGYRVLFDGTAIAYDDLSQSFSQEWKRKVRTLAGNWQLLGLSPALLLPFRNDCCWRFLSHKVFRLLVPFALWTMFVSCVSSDLPFYRLLAVLQGTFYLFGTAGMLIPRTRRFSLISLSSFFLIMNLAVVAGFWRWITGRCHTAWQPAYLESGEGS